MTIKLVYKKGWQPQAAIPLGCLWRLGMVYLTFTIPKAFGFEAATQPKTDNLQIHM